MNYLSHLLLSGKDKEVLLGNFIGDSVKGSRFEHFSEGVQLGIRLHRAIDHFTDSHPVTKESTARLRPHFRHYAGVIVDVFYDHILAVNWDRFHDGPLRDFTHKANTELGSMREQMPERSQRFYHYMVREDILYRYRELEGIAEVLRGMAYRTKFESGMEHAAQHLESHFEQFQQEFLEFFPELQDHSRQVLNAG